MKGTGPCWRKSGRNGRNSSSGGSTSSGSEESGRKSVKTLTSISVSFVESYTLKKKGAPPCREGGHPLRIPNEVGWRTCARADI